MKGPLSCQILLGCFFFFHQEKGNVCFLSWSCSLARLSPWDKWSPLSFCPSLLFCQSVRLYPVHTDTRGAFIGLIQHLYPGGLTFNNPWRKNGCCSFCVCCRSRAQSNHRAVLKPVTVMASAYCINTCRWIVARLVCFVHVVTGHGEAARSLSLKKKKKKVPQSDINISLRVIGAQLWSSVSGLSQIRVPYSQAR